MRKILLCFFLALLSGIASAQTFSGASGGDVFVLPPYRLCLGQDDGKNACFVQNGALIARLNGQLDFQLVPQTVATLPLASLNTGRTFRVTDGQNSSDCTTGGGIVNSVCYSNGSSWNPLGGGGSTGVLPNPATFPGAVNIPVGPLNTSGPINVNPTILPFFGLAPDPYCAYMVIPGNGQICNLIDPVTGDHVLAFNDGSLTPNTNQFLLMSDVLVSQQQQGAIPHANPQTGALDYNGISSGQLANNGATPHSLAINEGPFVQMGSASGLVNMVVTTQGSTADPLAKSLADLTPTLYAVGAGTANAQTVCPSPPITSGGLVAGLSFPYLPGVSNTAGTTLAVCGLTAKSVLKTSPTTLVALATGDLVTYKLAFVQYDGTQFELLNPVSADGIVVTTATAGTLAEFVTNASTSKALAGGSFTDVSGTGTYGGSQFVVPAGSTSTAGFNFSGMATNTGLFSDSATAWHVLFTGTKQFTFNASLLGLASGNALCWSSTTTSSATKDTGIDRQAAGVLRADATSGCGDGQGKWKAAAYISTGTTFTSSGGCTEASLVGGATAGKFTTSGSTGCTTTVTMGNTATAPTGWSCWVHDLTTVADYNNPHVTSSNATTVTIATGTIVASDVIEFGCLGY